MRRMSKAMLKDLKKAFKIIRKDFKSGSQNVIPEFVLPEHILKCEGLNSSSDADKYKKSNKKDRLYYEAKVHITCGSETIEAKVIDVLTAKTWEALFDQSPTKGQIAFKLDSK